MKKTWNIRHSLLVSLVISSILLTACGANSVGTSVAPPTSSLEGELPSEIKHVSTSTRSPTASISVTDTMATATPTVLPTVTRTPRPTLTPTSSPTSVPWGEQIINPENAQAMMLQATWGLGTPGQSIFSADGSIYVQGTPFGIYVYQAENLQLIRFLSDAREFFLSPVGDLLFARLPEGSIQVIDLPSGEIRFSIPPIAVLSPFMNDFIYSRPPAERPDWEAMYFELVTTMTALAISPDGTQAAIAFGVTEGDVTLGLWDLQSGTLIRQLPTLIVNNISELVFSPQGNKLLSQGHEGEIAVWQVAEGQLLWRLPNIGHFVGQPFSPDGSYLALQIDTGDTSDVLSWVAVRESRYGAEQGAQLVGSVASNAISPDNTRLLTTWWDTVSIWSIPHLQLVDRIRTGLDWPRASFSPDGSHILMNDGEQAYLVSDLSRDMDYPVPPAQVDLALDQHALQQTGHISGMLGLRYPQANQAFAWGVNSDQEAWVWDLTNNALNYYDFGSPFMADPDLSYDGDRLAACTEVGLLVIALADSQTSNLGRCRASGVVRFSLDGQEIIRANGILVDIVDSQTGELLHNLRGHEFNIEGLEITQDGVYLVSSGTFQYMRGREVIWWRVDEPRRIWQWWVSVTPSQSLIEAAFQSGDNVLHLAMGGMRSWRLGDGIQHHLDTTQTGGLAISPDSRLIAGADRDGLIHIWSLETWQELISLPGHRAPVMAMAFSPDGTGLLSLSSDGTIRLWGLP